MSTTYTQRYTEGRQSLEMMEVIAARNADPIFIGADAEGNECYVFVEDNTEVILTNAGLITEDSDGFADLRNGIA